MTDRQDYPDNDARHHTARLRAELSDTARHARRDIEMIDDPKAQALLETTAEVLDALVRTMDHFDRRSEPAWR